MSGKTYLVTGGNRGIGRAIVEALVRSGGQVAFTYHHDEASARALESDLGEAVRAYPLDLADTGAPEALAAGLEQRWDAIDGLVNNAGATASGLLALATDEEWQRTLEVNLGGVFRCCRAFLPQMLRRRRGSIVNIASLNVILGVAGQAVYGASKAGVVGLSKSLAREVGRRNVRVNVVAPGFVATDMTADLTEDQVAALRGAECLPGGVQPECVASAVRFLLSDAAASITGQCLVVDAGVSA